MRRPPPPLPFRHSLGSDSILRLLPYSTIVDHASQCPYVTRVDLACIQ